MAQVNLFNSVLAERPNRNTFDLSHDIKLSFNMGRLVPTVVMDIIPGDNIRISVENLIRCAPLVGPVMHDIEVLTYFFFVPNRLVWPNFEDFITDAAVAAHPYFLNTSGTSLPEGSIANYMGIPPATNSNVQINALPIAAYYKIYDDWFRAQDIVTEKYEDLANGNNTTTWTAKAGADPLRIAWRHDMFTSALPWAQKGDAVVLPLLEAGTAPVTSVNTTDPGEFRIASSGALYNPSGNTTIQSDTSGQMFGTDGATMIYYDPNGTLESDINAAAATINQLREAFRMQEFLELDALGGTRYNEVIRNHFGVITQDFRIQRPELIGMTSGKIIISDVEQTAPATAAGTEGVAAPLGTLGGKGTAAMASTGFNYYATEHGWLIGLLAVRPRAAYQQGLHRKWSRSDREDYFWPKFAHIGEQEITYKELYAETTPTWLDETFGYTPRYAEYRFEPNRVAGEFQTSLDFMHLGRQFGSLPQLNETFLECNPDARIFAVDKGETPGTYGSDQLWAHSFYRIDMSRLIPKYGKPIL